VLRPVTSPSSQLPITLLEIEDQFAFQVLQIVDFAPNFGDFAAQQVLDFPASMSTTVSQIKKLLDFLQREPESLHLLDKSESCYVMSGIDPEVPLGSGRSWQQCPALVEADRIYAKFRLLCGFTNLDCAAGTFESVRHKKIIHSGPYSRVTSAFAAREVAANHLKIDRSGSNWQLSYSSHPRLRSADPQEGKYMWPAVSVLILRPNDGWPLVRLIQLCSSNTKTAGSFRMGSGEIPSSYRVTGSEHRTPGVAIRHRNEQRPARRT